MAASLGPAVVAFAVYVRTLEPSVPTGDGAELVTAAWLLGVPHPPGYPLFTLLGHVFTWLPFGSPAYRVNLMSAVFAAGAVALVAFATYRLLDEAREAWVSRWTIVVAALVSGLALAFSSAFWGYGVVAEVFALNSFFASLIVVILLEWERRPERLRLLWAFGLVSGLAATNQQTIVLLVPACSVLLASGARKLLIHGADLRSGLACLARHAGIATVCLAVGLLPYLYLPLAAASDPALNWGDPRTLPAFLRHVLRSDYGTFHLTVAAAGAGSPFEHVRLLLAYLSTTFTWPGCLLAAAGLWWLWARRRDAAVALPVAFVCSGPAFLAYANPRIDAPVLYGVLERFYILPSLFVAPAIGAGACAMLGMLSHLTTKRPVLAIAGTIALLALPGASLALHFHENDQAGNTVEHDFGRDLLAPLEPNALLIIQGDATTMAVDYVQLVEQYRPDVLTLNMEKLKLGTYIKQMRRQHPQLILPFDGYVAGGDRMARLVQANWSARPVYVLGTPPEPGFEDRYDRLRSGFVVKLLPKGSAPDPYALDQRDVALLEQAHFPSSTYPDTTFEASIVQSYGGLAFDLGYVLDDGLRDAEAIAFYRLSTKLDPTNAPAYKNLGRLLLAHGAPPADTVSAWQTYLRLQPKDPEAPAIRARLQELGRGPR